MAASSHPPSPWPGRILWASLGAALAVLVTSARSCDEQPAGETAPKVVPAAAGKSVAAGAGSTGRLAVAPPELAPVVGSSTGASPIPTGTTGGAEASDGLATGDATTTDPELSATETAGGTPDTIPLPSMPGGRTMHRGQRRDEEHGDWILTHASWVPAPGEQVEAFYRTALQDAGMKVTGRGRPGASGQGYRATLRGRGRHAKAQITLQQRAGKLRTVVRIIWRQQ